MDSIQIDVKAVVDGNLISIEEVKDTVFSKKMIGDGCAIEPSTSELFSPISGKLIEVANAGHAYYLEHKSGIKFLIHIGYDSFYLNESGFNTYVQKGNLVEVGDKLGSFDLALLKANDYNTTITVIVLRNENYQLDIEKFKNNTVTAQKTTSFIVRASEKA